MLVAVRLRVVAVGIDLVTVMVFPLSVFAAPGGGGGVGLLVVPAGGGAGCVFPVQYLVYGENAGSR